MNNFSICLAGNPNVGKSTIFNGLTNLHQHTGNWAGKTVSNAKGHYIFNNNKYEIVDVPGTYSIMSYSEEEEIARNYLCFSNPDCIVIVVDATCLERSLILVYQIMEFSNKIIICVNLLDEAKKKEIFIDLKKLECELGIPVIGTVANKKKNFKALMQKIEDICTFKETFFPITVKYPSAIENAINVLQECINTEINNNIISRWISLKFLDGNIKILEGIENNYGIHSRNYEKRKCLQNAIDILKSYNINNNNFTDIVIKSILKQSEKVVKKVVIFKNNNYNEKDRKIDKIVTSKIWGIPIMISFLGIILWLTIIGANYPSNLLSNLFSIIENYLKLFLISIRCT